jgi:hypothetical protein
VAVLVALGIAFWCYLVRCNAYSPVRPLRSFIELRYPAFSCVHSVGTQNPETRKSRIGSIPIRAPSQHTFERGQLGRWSMAVPAPSFSRICHVLEVGQQRLRDVRELGNLLLRHHGPPCPSRPARTALESACPSQLCSAPLRRSSRILIRHIRKSDL